VGLVQFAAASRSGRRIQRERRFGAVGRSEVRRRSVLEALSMLSELAAGEKQKS
jgi:nicotinamide-nucleotide amidase